MADLHSFIARLRNEHEFDLTIKAEAIANLFPSALKNTHAFTLVMDTLATSASFFLRRMVVPSVRFIITATHALIRVVDLTVTVPSVLISGTLKSLQSLPITVAVKKIAISATEKASWRWEQTVVIKKISISGILRALITPEPTVQVKKIAFVGELEGNLYALLEVYDAGLLSNIDSTLLDDLAYTDAYP